jgi:hypothetical protein
MTSIQGPSRIQVTFANFEDLTSRLLLLPRVEDEGKGAVVASYSLSDPEGLANAKKETSPSINPPVLESPSSDSTECRDEKEDHLMDNGKKQQNNNLVGFVLVGTGTKNDLKDADFASILSAMRGQTGPIVLELERAEENQTSLRHDKSSSESESGDHEDDDYSSSCGSECSEEMEEGDHDEKSKRATATNTTTNMTSSILSGRLSAWGSRVRASAQLAAEVATDAVQSYQAAAASRAAKTSTSSADATSPPPCGLHVQTSLGAFLPLNPSKTNGGTLTSPRSSELAVTSSSVLYIRRSAVEACPPKGYTFQWYKGIPSLESNSHLEDWIELPGATSAAFQPSTTEVGYKLLCRVTVEQSKSLDSSLMDSEDESSDSEEEMATTTTTETFRCITPSTVSADLSLFNGARQALVRGAHFGGLVGKGNAQGRTFRVQVQMGYQDKQNKKKDKVASSVRVDQVSGETAEPLHTEPFHRVSANTSHANSKDLELKFRSSDLLDDASLMSALVSEDGCLELVAPNRFARESLLLAIGIANFTGEPSELEASTILYPPPCDDHILDDSSSEGSSTSGNSGASSANNASFSIPKGDEATRPQVVESLSLSPGQEPKSSGRPRGSSFSSMGSAGDMSTIASVSEDAQLSNSQHTSTGPSERETELEREVKFLRSKLAKKDKVVSELQRQITRSDSELQQANQTASQCQQDAAKLEKELQSSQKAQKKAEQLADQHAATIKKLKADHAAEIKKLNAELQSQENTIAELEKIAKSHQNEKAVLSAGVEARESKLAKMAELREQFVALSSKVAQQEQCRKDLEETNQRYQALKSDLQKMAQLEMDCRKELEATKKTLESAQKELEEAKNTAESCRSDLKAIQTKNQKLKSERNSYKQKADSLSKEISRICRNGQTLADIEKVLANDEARQEEVLLLRKQKRKALEECHSYRKSYEQSRAAQELLSQAPTTPNSKVDLNRTAMLLERNVELERLVTELTEYVNAKEMQLETMKQVNTALQEEIHNLAQANMHRNDI